MTLWYETFSQVCHPEIVGYTRGLYQCLRDLRVGAFILLDIGKDDPECDRVAARSEATQGYRIVGFNSRGCSCNE